MHAVGRLAFASHAMPAAALALPVVRWPLLAAWGVAQAGIACELLRPGSRTLAPNVTRLPEGGRDVAITFDDGPDPETTPCLLDALASRGARATFFLVGRKARAHPDLVRRIAAEGHEVGNHSSTHPSTWSILGRRRLESEIGEAQAALADLAGGAPRWFRPPMGHKNFHLAEALERHALRQVTWSLRSYDTVLREPHRVLKRILPRVKAGAIVLMHDRSSSATLVPLLEELRRRDLRAVSLRALPSSEPEARGAAARPDRESDERPG